ncbi:TonB-dependent receptor domain-containing protein [Chitinophaga nivalis]|uniref:TonB-dependent receptor n=1 Tax=Chitinophaga nivalis TaxID=2991709 RepID=A0ABT3IGY2_9BACT|nr:TonB-dependent receptor [Chitinophaga nivalis]MCW3467082.1 TonB-dependent receptor [Chitinophaga nivalis]MCW3483227.1 TonB-dependent receptor [Chitinophaga nivalis]
MKTTNMLWWLLLLTCSLHVSSQSLSTITIKGKLLAAPTKAPIPGAIVRFQQHTTSNILPVTTDATGTFTLRIPTGKWRVTLEALTFKTQYFPSLYLTRDTTFGDIYLEEDTKQLNTVTVTAAKSDIELKTDKKVFNVGKDIISKGGNANDILNNVPSVSVDIAGAVSLRGNENVRILINGKPSMLTVNNGLRQISAASIEKVEVITNPSAAHEAQGGAGIINIILKKNSQTGFNGSLQAGLGSPANNSINANLSYKTKKINLFGNIGYQYRAVDLNNDIYRANYRKDQSPVLRQYNASSNTDGNVNVYIGGDYYINDKNTLTGSYYHTTIQNKNTSSYDYFYLNQLQQPDSILSRREDYREPQVFNELELNYVKTFRQPGRKWTTNLQYDFWHDDENQDIRQQSLHPYTPAVSRQVTRDLESSNDFYLQSDYVTPVKKGGRLEMGLRANIRAIRSDYSASIDNIAQEQYTNKLYYDENIYGGYIQYGNKLKRFNYLLGLRSELSNIHISDRKQTLDKTKNYINLFPTVHLQYHLQEGTDLQLSYSRRINRPKFWQLNTFGGLSDTRNLTVGNPDLDPMYTNSFELGLLKKTGPFSFNPAVYYQYTTNYFDYILRQTEAGYFVRTPVNLSNENRYGAELATTYNPFAWWRLSLDINYFRFTQQGSFEGVSYQVSDQSWFTTFRSGFKFPEILAVDFSVNYRGEKKNVQTITKAQYRANIGVSKDFWHDKMTLSFTVNNLFDSQVRQQQTSTDTYFLDDTFRVNGRFFTGTVVYRFNRKKDQADRLPKEK